MSEPPTCLIPQNAQTPFDCWNLPDEGNRIFWHPELNIPAKGLTLMTGEVILPLWLSILRVVV